MGLFIVFILGIANFALHKAVLRSGHPLLAHLPALFRSTGGRFSYVFEYMMLTGSMLLVARGREDWVWVYSVYSMINALSAWLILTRRV
jgi:hypothetical protein